MVYFKACPRCHGDMHENRDIYGEYKECLNCGHMIDIEKKGGILDISRYQPKRKKAAA